MKQWFDGWTTLTLKEGVVAGRRTRPWHELKAGLG